MPGVELTDPGPRAPSKADIRLAFVEIERTHPEAAETLRRALDACEAERFAADLFREVVQHLERSSSTIQRVEPLLERGVEAIEAEAEARRKSAAAAERREQHRHDEAQAGRVTALEHVRGAWAAVRTASENRVVIAAVFSGLTWVATQLFGVFTSWLQSS